MKTNNSLIASLRDEIEQKLASLEQELNKNHVLLRDIHLSQLELTIEVHDENNPYLLYFDNRSDNKYSIQL